MSGVSFRANLVTDPRTEIANAKKNNLKDNVVDASNKATLAKDIAGARQSGKTDMYISVLDAKSQKPVFYRVDLNENKQVIDDIVKKVKSGNVKLDNNISFTPSKLSAASIQQKTDFKPDIVQAQKWNAGEAGLTGVQANKTINETYNKLDHMFADYIGTDKPVANWMTFGKYASREAGSQVKSLEGAIEALKTFGDNNGAVTDDVRAGKTLFNIMAQPDMKAQGALMGIEIVKGLVTDPKEQDKMLNDLKKAYQKGGDPASIAFVMAPLLERASAGAINNVIGKVKGLHDGLVEGNTLIYKNIAPAYEKFMAAEVSGKDGLQALKDAGYGKPSAPNDTKTFADDNIKDPQGFVMEAFKTYKEAKVAFTNGDDKKGEALMHKANLLIGCQEQMAILQRPSIFGDKLQKLVDAMNGTMTLTDGGGKRNALLGTKLDANGNQSDSEQINIIFDAMDPSKPKAKGWSDFETRMGIKEVAKGTPNSVDIRMPNGTVKSFVQREATDPKAQGTIAKYFSDGLSGTNATRNFNAAPRAMNQFYTSADFKIGSTGYQIGDNVKGPFTNARDAMAAAVKYNKDESFGKSDLMVMRNNSGKYHVRQINTLNGSGDDIDDGSVLDKIRFVGQSADNVVAVIAENGEKKFNRQFKP